MDIENLQILRMLVSDPNLSRAAERLHMSQSALSKRLRAIEDEVAVPLFERRGPHGLQPLAEALELAQLAERVGMAWENGVARVRNLAKEPRHFVLIGPEIFLREVVLPWWNRVSPGFPGLHFEVRVSEITRISLETVALSADAGILQHREELSDYICKPIYQERWGVVKNPTVQYSKLEKYIWGTSPEPVNLVDAYLVKPARMRQPVYRVTWQDLTALARWVAETPGAATVLPFHTVARAVGMGGLQFEPIRPAVTTSLYLAYLKKSRHQRFLRELAKLGEEAQGTRH